MDSVRTSRDFIEYPLWLTSSERVAWEHLNARYAPYVVTDAFGSVTDAVVPPLRECGWWSLYATALMCLAPGQVSPDDYEPIDKPFLPNCRPKVIDAFWAQRDARLRRFRRFLERWRLSSVFRLHSSGRQYASKPSTDSAPDSEDECVLWFHVFNTLTDIERYALRWSTNTLVESPVLRSHRLVVSRGIDLICSELLANAFEHSGGAKFFILAKLCTLNSARMALAIHRHRTILTPLERKMYEFAARHQCPILQLVIADEGFGFGGNDGLIADYEKSGPSSSKNWKEADLIRHALRPDVSTKERAQLEAAWAELMNAVHVEDYKPVIHGLSEVRLFVEEHYGNWRIHSNSALVDIDGLSRTITTETGRPVRGCVHYIQLPLLQDANDLGLRSLSLNTPRIVNLIPLDVAADANHANQAGQDSTARLQRIANFRRTLLDRGTQNNVAFVVNLLSLDEISLLTDDEERVAACALIADALHRVRSTAGVFLIASDATRSLLRRFKSTASLLDRRVLPYFNILSNSNAVAIDCNPEVKSVEPLLLQALDPWSEHAVLRSDNAGRWRLLEEVQHHNQGLFDLVPLPGGDVAFDGRVKAGADADGGRLLLGMRRFSYVGELLRASEGFLPWDDRKPYWFRSTQRTTHLNLGRLLANEDFKADLIAWFAAAAKSLAHERNTTPDRFVFVALLHPAIGITQELLRTRFPGAELIELSSLADVSADSWHFLNVVNRHVVCVADMVVTGATLTELTETIEYAGGRVAGALSLLALRDYDVPTKLFSFSECTEEQLKQWAPPRDRQPATTRIVDANSQFTEPVSGKLKRLDGRALALLERNGLLFAHRVFGRHHHTFPILVRTLLERGLAVDVINDIGRCINEHFPSNDFVVLYPGESTISYILRQNEEILPPDRCVALVPTFSSYGMRRLRVDRSRRAQDSESSRHVLFVDDSLSSGMTERLALQAWQEETKLAPTTWVTYVIVRRGASMNEPEVRVDRLRSAGDTHPRVYAQRHYCAIGPRSFSVGECPFCMGLERLKAASRLATPIHNRASIVLKDLVDSFKAMPVEGHDVRSLLEVADAAEFLTLATNPMWESAFHLDRGRPVATSGHALFVAFFAGDLSAYVSTDSITTLLADFAKGIAPDDSEASRHLLAALAVLPLNYSRPLVASVVRSLMRSANTATALAAIVLAIAQTDTLLTQFEIAGMSPDAREHRSGKLLQALEEVVIEVANEKPSIAPAARVMQLEMHAMASSGTADIVHLARTLSALFYDGAHTTLLLPQLDRLTPESISLVRQQLLNALTHLESFAAVSDVHIHRALADTRVRLQAAADDNDCQRFKKEAALVLESWRRLRDEHFHSARQLSLEAMRGLNTAHDPYAHLPGSYLWFKVEPPRAELAGWHVLGPEARHLREHFANLFTNTIKHAPPPFDPSKIAQAARGGTEGCVGTVGWRPDEAKRELVITYSQAIPLRRPGTIEGRGLMANSNALLSAFGGGISLTNNVHGRSEHAGLIEPVIVYETRMPLVLEGPR
jgi:hypoxanthine-guanine phosphoribosyltransferase